MYLMPFGNDLIARSERLEHQRCPLLIALKLCVMGRRLYAGTWPLSVIFHIGEHLSNASSASRARHAVIAGDAIGRRLPVLFR
jgi:hypothetical protein